MRYLTNISLVTNILLIVVIILLRECQRCPECPQSTTTTDTIVKTDTVKIKGDVVYKPMPYEVVVSHTDTIRDTIEAVRDYLYTRLYNLPVIDDSTGKINLHAEVQRNRIQSYYYTGSVFHKVVVVENNHYIIEKKNKVFAGFGIGVQLASNPNQLTRQVSLPIDLTLINKQDNLYKLSYDIMNNSVQIGMGWKLSKK